MTIIRCIDCEFDNVRMTDAGYEIIGIEDHRWADGHTETEILWGRDEPPIGEHNLPYWPGAARARPRRPARQPLYISSRRSPELA